MNRSKIRVDTEQLDAIREALNSGMRAKVGILGSGHAGEEHMAGESFIVDGKQHRKRSKQSSGLTNAEVAMKNEFGSYTDNIPPRSFLRMPLETKTGELVALAVSNTIRRRIMQADLEGALTLIGIKAEAIIQEAFASGGFGKWKPNAPLTVKLKGSSSPLIDTGQLRRAVTSEVVKA